MQDTDIRPNILFVMVDQLNPLLTSVYGHPIVRTPALDSLARDGVVFDSAYTPYPLCAPARAAFMTGKYASSIGVIDNASMFPSDELTIPHYLGGAGYDCVASGKLHFVGPDQLHGFSRRLTSDIYPEDFSWLQPRDPSRAFDPALRGGHAFQYTSDAIHVGEWRSNLSYDEEAHFRSVEYLRAKGLEKRRKQLSGQAYQPFFLFTSFHHPHDPFWPPQPYWDLYENVAIDLPTYPDNLEETFSILDRWLNHWHQVDSYDVRNDHNLRIVRRAYYALVTYVDSKLGDLLNTLRESGLDDDTVVVFASDHGEMLGERGMVQKRNFYEGSVRVPLIVRFPDRRYSGNRVTQPVSLLDLLPTFVDIAGMQDALPHDGKNLMPLISGNEQTSRAVYSESHAEGVYGVCFMLRTQQYKYVYILHPDGEDEQLFNLESDPGEWINLAGDASSVGVVSELRRRLLQRFQPPSIEENVQKSFRTRALLKKWSEQTSVSWNYTPKFDSRRKTTDQYLP